MLVIALHNNHDYLEHINKLAKEQDITNTTFIQKEDIGTYLIGEHIDVFVQMGSVSHPYDKAFIVIVDGEEKAKHFLNTLEEDNRLEMFNSGNTGFICSVPFNYIKHLELHQSQGEEMEK